MGELTTDGQSRRELIKKGAVAGGIIWAAPMLLSSGAEAATVGNPTGSFGVCTQSYRGKTSGATITNINCENANANGYSCVTATPFISGCPTYISGDTATRTIYLSGKVGNVASGAIVQNVVGFTKAGSNGCGAADVTYIPPGGSYPHGAFQLVFPAQVGGSNLSHIEFSFCA